MRRSVALAAGAGAILLLSAPAALAHVRVVSTDATQGGFAVLTFRVPTESDTASTTKLTVRLPTDHPLAFVSVQPHPGWSYTVEETKLDEPIEVFGTKIDKVVGQIVWRADGAATAVKPGEFEQFNISVGPLPETDSLTFPALQGYSDGSVVRWVEVAAPGSGSEPEHPAPVLQLAAAADGASAPVTGPVATATGVAEDDDGEDDDSDLGTILGVIGIALGATALVAALRRRPTR